MATTFGKTFKSGNSEAVRLPRGIGFGPGTEVRIERRGDQVVIEPSAERKLTVAEFIAEMRKLGPMPDGVQERPGWDWPDRPGLYD